MGSPIEGRFVPVVAYGDMLITDQIDALSFSEWTVRAVNRGGGMNPVVIVARAIVGGAVVEVPPPDQGVLPGYGKARCLSKEEA